MHRVESPKSMPLCCRLGILHKTLAYWLSCMIKSQLMCNVIIASESVNQFLTVKLTDAWYANLIRRLELRILYS